MWPHSITEQDEPLPTPVDINKARRIRDEERAQAIANLIPEAAKAKFSEELHDQAEIIRPDGIADAILAAEARLNERPFTDYADHHPQVKQKILHDGLVVLRIRRARWRLIARGKLRQAILDGLKEHTHDMFAKKFGPDDRLAMACVADFITGPAFNAVLETLSGRIDVTAREYAAASLGLPAAGDE